MGLKRQTIRGEGIDLRVHVAGEGEPVLLLHGFPDSADLWREVVPRLVAAGYQVVVPDQRGYGESDAPEGKNSYRVPFMVKDALAVLDHLGIERAHLVGHDWGAVVGWVLAGSHPDRFFSFTPLAVGHFEAYFKGGLEQMRLGWYVILTQLPKFGEWAFASRDWKLIRDCHKTESDRWVSDLSRPGRMTAAMNWYRANVPNPTRHPNVSIPVLGVWSTDDLALTEKQMTASEQYVTGPWRYQRFENVGHWLPLDVPEELSTLLVEFFRSDARSELLPEFRERQRGGGWKQRAPD